ncbi:arylsulfatase [Blastomonas fulva]|jgi:arylsulfatase A-like enzyme|uniref:arylsulfatase n=1 Tax=Blastomonas fulva TaxID=1550728 RepID=UPI003D2B091C
MTRRAYKPLLASVAVIFSNAPAIAQAVPEAPVAQTQQTQLKPHVIVWMLDDIGFAQLSCFGGLVRTPNIDRVANRGVRYTNYRTAPICSASRAALLTGRNPHSVHVGGHAGATLPYPGYDAHLPASAGTIAANMKAAGYQTVALGKWDHLPGADMTQAGPFNLWPTGQGFDKFYGFIGADADNWQPVLLDGTSPVATPAGPGYHLNDDLADRAIAAFDARSARRDAAPMFIYLATGTAHAPHHAPQTWIDRYKGQFDMGWDKARDVVLKQQIAMGIMPKGTRLAPRPEGMPAWETLSPDDKKLYARQMEVFAAAVSHADEQFGRILDALEAKGELDHTIIAITSDNGASAEGAYHGTHNETLFMNGYYPSAQENRSFVDRWGGPETQPHYAFGWAVAGNTPLRNYKQTTHDGGIRVPLIVSWPKAVAARGDLRSEFASVADVMPTILDLAGVPLAPTINNVAQVPMEGVSLKPKLLTRDAATTSRAQYFEMYGNKGLWHDGWTIVTSHRLDPWRMDQMSPITERWELYHTDIDPGQTIDLAAKRPDKVSELAALFEEQARLYYVNPISNFGDSRAFGAKAFQAEMAARKGLWAFDRPMTNIGYGAAPPIAIRPFDMKAQIELISGDESGPIFAFGGSSGGMAAYLLNGVPGFAFRDLSGKLTTVQAAAALPKGTSNLTLRVERATPKPMSAETVTVTIMAGDQVLVRRDVQAVIPAAYGVAETFDIGLDRGSTVSPTYAPDKPFSGRLGKVSFQIR